MRSGRLGPCPRTRSGLWSRVIPRCRMLSSRAGTEIKFEPSIVGRSFIATDEFFWCRVVPCLIRFVVIVHGYDLISLASQSFLGPTSPFQSPESNDIEYEFDCFGLSASLIAYEKNASPITKVVLDQRRLFQSRLLSRRFLLARLQHPRKQNL